MIANSKTKTHYACAIIMSFVVFCVLEKEKEKEKQKKKKAFGICRLVMRVFLCASLLMICYYQYGCSLYCKSVNVVALSGIC